MNKTRFVTFYPKCHNAGLLKDVGQIPNTLGNQYSEVESVLVSCIVDLSDECINQLTGVKICKIPFFLKDDFLTGLFYICKNARNVDWFNFYHGGRKVYYWTRLYKLLNPKGKVYLKMDLGFNECKKYSERGKEYRIFNRTSKIVDIISVESKAILSMAQKCCDREIKLINNGYIEEGPLSIKETKNREKCFITVGRLGTPEKATDLLLQAFAQTAECHSWNIKLVGPIEEEFKKYIKDYFNNYPQLVGRVIFTGAVFDKKELYQIYNSSRVFILPSRWEGFPLVGPEALHCGCRMILTDVIPPISELTNDGKYGVTIKTNNVNAIAEAILLETRREVSDSEPMEISSYAKKYLSWETICDKLYRMMMEIK